VGKLAAFGFALGKLHWCCCSPELPHDETQKFVLFSSDDNASDVIFPLSQGVGDGQTQGSIDRWV
jgi:hypothetical protein